MCKKMSFKLSILVKVPLERDNICALKTPF